MARHLLHLALALLVGWTLAIGYMGLRQDRLYEALARHALKDLDPADEEARALRLLDFAHDLVKLRRKAIGEWSDPGLRYSLLSPANIDLVLGDGGCGSYVYVFIRLLKSAGLSPRIIQMQCVDYPGCHMVAEVRIGGQWSVMDPTYRHAFRHASGRIATVDELVADFSPFVDELPESYNPFFNYQGYLRTNWNRYPTVLPKVRAAASALLGEESVSGFSARVYMLNEHWVLLAKTWSVVALAVLMALVFAMIRRRAFGGKQVAVAKP